MTTHTPSSPPPTTITTHTSSPPPTLITTHTPSPPSAAITTYTPSLPSAAITTHTPSPPSAAITTHTPSLPSAAITTHTHPSPPLTAHGSPQRGMYVPSYLELFSSSPTTGKWTVSILVSCPDPTLSRGKGSGDHWAIPWLCRVSSLDTEQPNEIVLHHATMCSTDRPICSLMPRPHPRFCNATEVTWLMAFCWLDTTKESLNGHQTPFLMRGCGLGTRLYLLEFGLAEMS